MPASSSPSPSSDKKSRASAKVSKKKGKKKEEEIKKKLAEEEAEEENELEFQKALLEIRVNELETLNLGLKKKSDYLETQNDVYQTQLRETREEKEELVGFLERSWKEEKALVKELEEKLVTAEYALAKDTKAYEQRLKVCHSEFEALKTKLEKQVSDLEIQMTALDEFQSQRDTLNQKFQNLEKAFVDERKAHQQKYEELENELIKYREKIKNEALETLLSMATDIQKAGKLCLTGAVKTAIAANAKLREELETVSKDNLRLRDRLEASSMNLQKCKSVLAKTEKLKSIDKRKSDQYKHILQFLLDKQCKMDERIVGVGRVEKELEALQRKHSFCKTDEEVEAILQQKTEEFSEQLLKIQEEVKIDLEVRTELKKLQEIMAKLAITAKELTEARNSEEYEFLSHRLKVMIAKVYEIASQFPNLAPSLKSRLVVATPKILPVVAFH